MNIFAPDRVRVGAIDTTRVYVNVFAGSERSKVMMSVGKENQWIPMYRVQRPDPLYAELKAEERRALARRQQLARSVEQLIHWAGETGDRHEQRVARLAREIDALASTDGPNLSPLPQEVTNSPHLWELPLPNGLVVGTHVIRVRTVDMFGHTYMSYRMIRVDE
jgi:hypothetical protein